MLGLVSKYVRLIVVDPKCQKGSVSIFYIVPNMPSHMHGNIL